MDNRQKKLVRDYGPAFIVRVRRMLNDCIPLYSDAISIFTDEEWAAGAEAIKQFMDAMNKLQTIAANRTEEALNDGEKFIDLYAKAKENLKRFG